MQPAASFQAVEHRVKRGHVETNRAAGALLDEFADFVAVARAGFDERERMSSSALPFFQSICDIVLSIYGQTTY